MVVVDFDLFFRYTTWAIGKSSFWADILCGDVSLEEYLSNLLSTAVDPKARLSY